MSVRVIEGPCHLAGDLQGRLDLQLAMPLEHLHAGRAIDVFHREEMDVVLGADVMHLDDVLMVELAGGAGFADELIDPLALLAVFRAEDLEGHLAGHGTLLGLVDDAHAAFAELLMELVLDHQISEFDVAGLAHEEEFDLADADAIAEGEQAFIDLLAVELGAVARSQIHQAEEPPIAAHLTMGTRGHIVDDLHIGIGLTTHHRQFLHQQEFAAGGGSGLGNQFSHKKQRPR
jgi:hypothetical protein